LLLPFNPFSSKVWHYKKRVNSVLQEVNKMDKALRVLAIIILILAIVAMVFAQLSFDKRQVLLGRNSQFEEYVIKVAKTIEAVDAPEVAAPDLQKDVAEVADRELPNPDRDSILANYPAKYETQQLQTLDYSTDEKKRQLRTYYVLDAEGKKIRSSLDGQYKKDGPGSMMAILDEMLTRSMAQNAVLQKTRGELTKMREMLTKNIEEMNKMKADWRVTKRELTESRAECEKLKEEKAALEAQVAKLQAEKKELQAELENEKAEVERLKGEAAGLRETIAQQDKLIKDLKDRFQAKNLQLDKDEIIVTALSAGVKGKIVDANDEYKFVIIEFTDAAMVEMLGEERKNKLPQLELNVRRTGRQSASGEFVTRIKLSKFVKGKNLVVAEILSDWQQVPVEKDDVVFF
jgi:chromosome segregation ATPase